MAWIARLALPLLLAGCAAKAPNQCAAWGCHRVASDPLAWTRPGAEAQSGFLSTGDLCPEHVAKVPFVFVTRYFVFYAIFPALIGGWVIFRILYVVDQHGPGLPSFLKGSEERARRLLFGLPVLASAAWLAFFTARALL